MPAEEDLARIDSQWAVKEDWNVGNTPGGLQTLQVEQEALRPSHCECRNNHGATPSDGSADDFGEGIFRIPHVMPAISVGRFDHQIVGVFDLHRVDHGRVVVTAEIAGEDNRSPVPVELNGGRAQDMTRAAKKWVRTSRKTQALFEFYRLDLFEGSKGIWVTVIVRIALRPCREPGKPRIFKPVRESSGNPG
jgi:hypothetical protein